MENYKDSKILQQEIDHLKRCRQYEREEEFYIYQTISIFFTIIVSLIIVISIFTKAELKNFVTISTTLNIIASIYFVKRLIEKYSKKFINDDSSIFKFKNKYKLLKNLSREELEVKLKESLKIEDYLLAEKIKRELNKF